MRAKGGNDEIRRARRWAAASMLLNGVLAGGKGLAGWLAGSTSLMGDAVHSATDVVGSAAAFLGLWLAGREHPSFPYGLYKAENLATLVTSVVIILAGYEIARHALLGAPAMPQVGLALPVALVSLAVAVAFGLLQLSRGRRLGSPALMADARDYLTDGLSTALVVLGLAAAGLGWNLERWAAAGVAVFVFFSGGQLMWRAVRDLMDQAMDRSTERDMVRLVESNPGVEGVEQVLSRTAGGRFLVDIDVALRTHSLEKAARLARNLEEEVARAFPRAVSVRVRARSMPKDHLRRFTPVTAPDGVLEPHLARAPWFLLEEVDLASGRVLHRQYLENPHGGAETKRGFLVGRWLLSLKPDQVRVAERKEGTAAALLEEAGVELLTAGQTDDKQHATKEAGGAAGQGGIGD